MFYRILLFAHSTFRWLVLLSLLYTIGRSINGLRNKSSFSQADNAWRHWTATIAHIQLMLGMVLYFQSPLTRLFRQDVHNSMRQPELRFFGMIHITVMLLAVIALTLGSAMAKRKVTDTARFRTILIWFTISLFIIFLAIPWPNLWFPGRPWIRKF